MRIALFTETFLPKIDGIVTRLTHTVKHLQRSGDEVMVVAPAGGPRRYEGARVLGVPAVPFALYPELKLAITGKKVGTRLSRFEPDLVHVVNPAVLGACGVAHAVKRTKPLVASYHTHVPKYLKHYKLGALEGFAWKVIRGMHNKAQLNLCTSTAMIEELNARGFHHLALWPRAVDTELFRPELKSEAMRARALRRAAGRRPCCSTSAGWRRRRRSTGSGRSWRRSPMRRSRSSATARPGRSWSGTSPAPGPASSAT